MISHSQTSSARWLFVGAGHPAPARRSNEDQALPNRPAPSARLPRSIHYGPGEDRKERIDFPLIREAAKQIDMAAYVLTDSAVLALVQRPCAV